MAEVDDELFTRFRLDRCFKVINKYAWLLDSYVLDFFTENHMERLPKCWRHYLENASLEEFYYLVNVSAKSPAYLWPLSMLCLRVLIQDLALPRKIERTGEIISIESNRINIIQMHIPNKMNSVCFKHPKCRNLFLRHVKPKKRYEIFKIAKTTAEIASKLNVDYVVDVGSGMGHLSRIMSYGFELNVCSIETQTQLTQQARKLDTLLEGTIKKYLNELEFSSVKSKRPVHMNQTIQFDLTAGDFVKNIKSAFDIDGVDNFKFGIVGLHPCGDLTSILLRLYTDSPEAKFINLVGCCYHKLSISSDSKNYIGFPMTKSYSEKYGGISYEARALACHAIESYSERLTLGNCELKVHCYRAALEKIIDKNWPHLRKSALGNVKWRPELTFKEYCRIALSKLNITVDEDDIESQETKENLCNWKKVVQFYSLRLMLAPLVETAILLDRKMYLLEKGIRCEIKAAFDPVISPRNQVLISEKIKPDNR